MRPLHRFETIRNGAIVLQTGNAGIDVHIPIEEEHDKFMSDGFEDGKCKQGPQGARLNLQGYIRRSQNVIINKPDDTFTIGNSLLCRLRRREFTLDPLENLREKLAMRFVKGEIKQFIRFTIVMTLFSIGNIFERICVFLINRLPDDYIKHTIVRSKRAEKMVKILEDMAKHESDVNQSTMMTELIGNDSRAAAVLILQLSYLTLTEHKASKLPAILKRREIHRLISDDLDRILKGRREENIVNGKLINIQEFIMDNVMTVEPEPWNEILVEKFGMDEFSARALVEYSDGCSSGHYQPDWADLSPKKKICAATFFFLNALNRFDCQGPSARASAIIHNLDGRGDEEYVVGDNVHYNFLSFSSQFNPVKVFVRRMSDVTELCSELLTLINASKRYFSACDGVDRVLYHAKASISNRIYNVHMRKQYNQHTLHFERNGLWFTFEARQDGIYHVNYNEEGTKPEVRIASSTQKLDGIAHYISKNLIYKSQKTYESALEYTALGNHRFVNQKRFIFGLNVLTNTHHILNSMGITFINILFVSSRTTEGITVRRNIAAPMIAWGLVLTIVTLVVDEIRNNQKVLSYLDHVGIYIGVLFISATLFSLSSNTNGSVRNLLRFKASFSSVSQLRKHFSLSKNEIDTVLYLCPQISQIIDERNASFIPQTKTGHLIVDEKINTYNTLQLTGFIIQNYYYDFRTRRFWLIEHDSTSKLLDDDLVTILREELEKIESLRQSLKQVRSETKYVTDSTLQDRIISDMQDEISRRERKWRSINQNFGRLESRGFAYNYFLD